MVNDEQGAMTVSSIAVRNRQSTRPRVPTHARAAGVSDRADPTRLPMAVVALALLLMGVVGWACGNSPAKGAGFTLFAVVGFGSACAIAIRRRRWPALAYSIPLGMTVVLLAGFVLVEAKVWSVGVPLFVGILVFAALLNLLEVGRAVGSAVSRSSNARSSRSSRPRLSASPGRQSVVLADGGYVADGHVSEGQVAGGYVAGDYVAGDYAAGDGGVEEPQRLDLHRRLAAIAFALSGIGLGLCIFGAWLIKNFVPHGPGATLAALPPIWYAGIACVIAAVIVGLIASGWVAGASVVTLQLAVVLTPAIVYSLPRYSWTYKHLGVVEYVLHHGSVHAGADIYQAWPALFAGAAWVCHSVGISNPTVIARWFPTVIDIGLVFAVQRLAVRVLADVRRSWLAAAIVVVGNMIGQDYFSPQAAGFLLAVAIFAAVYRRRGEGRGMEVVDWVVVAGIVVAVALTHQLSPYMIVGATVILAIFGLCRSRLVPVVTLISAGGWALLHIDVVRRYFTFNQFGDVTANALTKGFVSPGIHKSMLIHYDSYAMAIDAGLIGIMALLVLAQRRTIPHLALALCAASGAGLFVANSYGNEGAFRVFMFALPWLAVLCSDWDTATAPRLYWMPVASLPLLLGTYLFADWGLDFMNAVRPGDLQMEQAFEMSAPSGSRLFVLGSYLPIKTTYRYNLFKYRGYSGIVTTLPRSRQLSASKGVRRRSVKQTIKQDAENSFSSFMREDIPHKTKGLRKHKYYVVAGSSSEAAVEELSRVPPAEYKALKSEFLRSGDWAAVAHTKNAELLKLVSLFFDPSRPTISGVAQDGEMLTVDRGTWQSLNPLHFSYQWQLCGVGGTGCTPIPGATHQRLHLRAADVGHRLTVSIKVTDSKGRSSQASASTAVVGKPFPPTNVVLPSIQGTAAKGDLLTVHVGKWQSADKLQFNYQWEECSTTTSSCTALGGNTKPFLRLRRSYEGTYISAIVTAVDREGQSTQAAAPRLGPIAP